MGLPFLLVDDGQDDVPVLSGLDERGGLIGLDLVQRRLLVLDEGQDIIAALSIDPAACFYGVGLRRARPRSRLAAEAAVPRFAPRGYKFHPLPRGVVSGFPTRQIQKHRREVPSLNTIRLSVIFAGLSIQSPIERTEAAFGRLADLFVARGRTFAPLEEILHVIEPLGLRAMRSQLYEESDRWIHQVQDAFRRGLRDRELRRHLFLETETPTGISLAKLSFVLALLGQDTVCLDARLLSRMFGHRRGEVEQSWRTSTPLSLRRYEAAENAFLKGNRFYNPKDPLGRARAQWASWESVGRARAEHRVWLDVVRGEHDR